MKILIAYDGSTCADAAIADLRNAGLPREAEVQVVTVAHDEWPHTKPADGWGQFDNPRNFVMKEAEECADKARKRIQSDFPGWQVTSEALWGNPAGIIRKTIEHAKPDLIVVGSHGRSLARRLLLGSISLDVVHHATCSVRVVRETTARPARNLRIVIASDGSEHSNAVIDEVRSRSWPEGTEVRILSVLERLAPQLPALVPALEGRIYATEPAYEAITVADDHEREHLSQFAEKAARKLENAGLSCSVVLLDGDPRTAVVEEAARFKAGAIFVGARGLSALDRFLLGSVSTFVVAHANCAVEVVRG